MERGDHSSYPLSEIERENPRSLLRRESATVAMRTTMTEVHGL